jgi:hypothetical protein
MDVYGKKPKTPKGQYFRNNIWYWHPLWDFCCESFPEITEPVKYGHTNDGDGLGSRASTKLAKGIKEMLSNGDAQKYVAERDAKLANLNRVDCELCNATGIRTDQTGVEMGMDVQVLDWEKSVLLGREKGWCNGCSGEGTTEAWANSYRLTIENITEFAQFLENCGGFTIN